MNNPYQFQDLSGVAPVAWTNDLHFVATGMTWDYDMRRMSTGDNRRDFGAGISGTQFSAKVETSFGELHLGNQRCVDVRTQRAALRAVFRGIFEFAFRERLGETP